MNGRQAYAYAHPISDAGADLTPHRALDRQADGNLLMSILAVDR